MPLNQKYCLVWYFLFNLIVLVYGSHKYSKVVVFSKAPLPNYRYDLDERRPQREVCVLLCHLPSSIPFSMILDIIQKLGFIKYFTFLLPPFYYSSV